VTYTIRRLLFCRSDAYLHRFCYLHAAGTGDPITNAASAVPEVKRKNAFSALGLGEPMVGAFPAFGSSSFHRRAAVDDSAFGTNFADGAQRSFGPQPRF
jgi:hypothetical protein